MHKILSVDDEPINQTIVEELFGDTYDISLVSSGEECLEKIDCIQPAIILLDVSMPGIDGYETCRQLKQRESSKKIPVIFVSARSTLEDKISGYEVGGYDYITKPFDHTELAIKIDHIIDNGVTEDTNFSYPQDNESRVKAKSSESLPYESLTPSFLTETIKFLDAGFNCHSFKKLGQLLLSACEHLGFNCTLQIRTDSGNIDLASMGEAPPLEYALIDQTQGKGRFFDFNNKTIVFNNHVSLLVKNLPFDEPKRTHALKTLLMVLVNGTESRITGLTHELALQYKLEQTLEILKTSINDSQTQMKKIQQRNTGIVMQWMEGIDSKLKDFSLDEQQLEEIQSISIKHREQFELNQKSAIKQDQQLNKAQKSLRRIFPVEIRNEPSHRK